MIKKSQNNKNIIDTYLKNLKATSPMDFEEKIKAEIRRNKTIPFPKISSRRFRNRNLNKLFNTITNTFSPNMCYNNQYVPQTVKMGT